MTDLCAAGLQVRSCEQRKRTMHRALQSCTCSHVHLTTPLATIQAIAACPAYIPDLLSDSAAMCTVYSAAWHRMSLVSAARLAQGRVSIARRTQARAAATMVAQVGVVTTIGCPYCKKAKQALKDQGVQYDEAELGSARDVLKQVKETTGQGTVPQV